MLDIKNLVALGKLVANKKTGAVAYSYSGKDYSYSDLQETFRAELLEYAKDYNAFRRNRLDIYELMQEIIDEVLPARIMENYGKFAEIKQFNNGDKAIFARKAGKNRAKAFITKVGLAGVYEVFKLDKTFAEVDVTAYGGAAQVGLEEFLDGVVDFSELIEIIINGLDESVYTEIAKAVETLYDNVQASNKATGAGFVAAEMDKLLVIARAYGTPTIYTTLELAQKIVPADGWVSDTHKQAMANQGYVGIYKGVSVVVLPQSFTDETNTTKVLDPSLAYIFVSEGNSKPVKVALEGSTIIDDFTNADRSREIQAYKKFGVSVITTNDVFVYKATV